MQLAQRVGGHVTLLHVVELPETAHFSTYGAPINSAAAPNTSSNDLMEDVFVLKLLQTTKRHMHQLIAEARNTAPDVTFHDLLETTNISRSILKVIDEHKIDLVVMGAQGHTAMEHFFAGSNTERLVRLAPCPVLSVKHAAPFFHVRQIVFPSTFTPEADGTISGLRRVQALFPNATLHLLHVAAGTEHQAADLAKMEQFAAKHQLQHYKPAVVTAHSASAGILDFTQQTGADLVVVPTHGRTGLSRYLQNSIAERIATHAFPPVLTFKLA